MNAKNQVSPSKKKKILKVEKKVEKRREPQDLNNELKYLKKTYH